MVGLDPVPRPCCSLIILALGCLEWFSCAKVGWVPTPPGAPIPKLSHSFWLEQELWGLSGADCYEVLCWSPEQLEAVIFEKSLETVGKSFSFSSSKWLVTLSCDLCLIELGFNCVLCWQESKSKCLESSGVEIKFQPIHWNMLHATQELNC